MSLRAVIFDADGVLVHANRFKGYLEQKLARGTTGEFFGGPFQKCLIGEADMADTLPPFLEHWGWEGGYDDFVSTWLDIENAVDERVLETIQDLRRLGYVCALATNQEQHRGHYMKTTMGFESEFDRLFFSYKIGAAKPDEKFYRTIEEALGLSGPEILFWDDTRSHIDAAKKRGWRAELYTDYEDFSRKMRALLGLEDVSTYFVAGQNGAAKPIAD